MYFAREVARAEVVEGARAAAGEAAEVKRLIRLQGESASRKELTYGHRNQRNPFIRVGDREQV